MPQEDFQSRPDSDCDSEALATYQKWKWSRGAIPWRLPFGGLFTIGLALALSWEHLWSTPRRWVLVATCLYLVSGVLSLFYDIPRKRLSRYSRMFLIVGTLGPFALLVLAILWKKLAL